VSLLSDWPLAYHRITFAYDGRANRTNLDLSVKEVVVTLIGLQKIKM
jgi:hypothetical protein